MPLPLLLAVASVTCFLALAHAAVRTPVPPFRRMTTGMAVAASLLVVVSPAAGAALLGPVVLSRRLATHAVPRSVEELLDRYPLNR